MMTSCGHPIQEPERGHGQNRVESLSQAPHLTLDRMGHGDKIAPQETLQDAQARSGPIAEPGGLDSESLVPVPLELPGKIFQPSTVENLIPERPKDRADRVTEARPEGGRPQSMHRRAVLAAVLDRPDRLDITLEIAGNVAVNPNTASPAPRAAPRTRPRISLAFFRQPLYIGPKMEYQ